MSYVWQIGPNNENLSCQAMAQDNFLSQECYPASCNIVSNQFKAGLITSRNIAVPLFEWLTSLTIVWNYHILLLISFIYLTVMPMISSPFETEPNKSLHLPLSIS